MRGGSSTATSSRQTFSSTMRADRACWSISAWRSDTSPRGGQHVSTSPRHARRCTACAPRRATRSRWSRPCTMRASAPSRVKGASAFVRRIHAQQSRRTVPARAASARLRCCSNAPTRPLRLMCGRPALSCSRCCRTSFPCSTRRTTSRPSWRLPQFSAALRWSGVRCCTVGGRSGGGGGGGGGGKGLGHG